MSNVEEETTTSDLQGDDSVDGNISSSSGSAKSKRKPSKDKSKKPSLFKRKAKSELKTGSKKDSKSKSKGETDAKEDLEEAGGEKDSARGSSVTVEDTSSMVASTASKILSEADESKPEKKHKKKLKFGVFGTSKSKKHTPAVESPPQAQTNPDEPSTSVTEEDDSGHVMETVEVGAGHSEVTSQKVEADEARESEQPSERHSTSLIIHDSPREEASDGAHSATLAIQDGEKTVPKEESDGFMNSKDGETPGNQGVSGGQTSKNDTVEDVVPTEVLEILQEMDSQILMENKGEENLEATDENKAKEDEENLEATDENKAKEDEEEGGKADEEEEKEGKEKLSAKEEITANESEVKEQDSMLSKETEKINDEISPQDPETREEGDKKTIPSDAPSAAQLSLDKNGEDDSGNLPERKTDSERRESHEKSMESSMSTTKRRTIFSLKYLCCNIL